jgi:hypothetical protein
MSDEAKLPGVEALQAAALQMIHAAQGFLALAEQVVSDPKAAQQAAATMASMAKMVLDSYVPPNGSSSTGATPTTATPVERIELRDDSA